MFKVVIREDVCVTPLGIRQNSGPDGRGVVLEWPLFYLIHLLFLYLVSEMYSNISKTQTIPSRSNNDVINFIRF